MLPKLEITREFYWSTFSYRYLLARSQKWKHQKNVWNLFKVDNNDTRTTSITSFLCYVNFEHFSVSTVDFKHVNTSWVHKFSLIVVSLKSSLSETTITVNNTIKSETYIGKTFHHRRILQIMNIQPNIQNIPKVVTKSLHYTNMRYLFKVKGCVRYIFASLFFKSKGGHLWNKEKCFLFHSKSSFRSRENQILEF